MVCFFFTSEICIVVKMSFRDMKQLRTPVGVIFPFHVLNPTSTNVKQM